jgi:uncharacterized repeat protein (TIGR01451 family)
MLAISCIFLPAIRAAAPGFTVSTFAYPGATNTTIYGINKIGQIVGGEDASGSLNGFLYSASGNTTFNDGAAGSYAEGINNNGDIVGLNLASGAGFLLSGGFFTPIVVPGSDAGTTNAIGINDAGQIVGSFKQGGVLQGFLLIGETYTTLAAPGATATVATGINNNGQIVGWFTSSGGATSGFSWSSGSFTTLIAYPGATSTQALGINNSGQIVGQYTGGGSTSGFVLQGVNYASITAGSLIGTTTVNTTLTVQTSGGSNSGGYPTSGTATLSGIGSGTFNATVPIAPDPSGNYDASFSITLTNGNIIYGTLTIPTALFSGGGSGSGAINAGAGAYFGASGSFPALAGTGAISNGSLTLQFSGAGSITTQGGNAIVANMSAYGINDAGQIVGSYVTGGTSFGFLAAPDTVTVSVNQYPVQSNSDPTAITLGSDSALWYTSSASFVGRITTAGVATAYGAATGHPADSITSGPDGALWLAEPLCCAPRFGLPLPGFIGRATTSGTTGQYSMPANSNQDPLAIAAGSDGALWFTDGPGNAAEGDNQIWRVTTSGVFSSYPLPPLLSLYSGDAPVGITPGLDGALWFTYNSAVGRISTSGAVSIFPLTPGWATGTSIVAGPDGALWFTSSTNQTTVTNQIGRMATSGAVTEYPVPAAGGGGYQLEQITAGPDGALWFTESPTAPNAPLVIGRITTSGVVTQYLLPEAVNGGPVGIAAGPDGGLWFTENALNSIGEIVTSANAPAPQLSVTKTHTGNFTQLQTNATYTVTVSNQATAGSTTGTITVTDTLPPGLSLVSMSGSGWTCAANSCSRNEFLPGGASYPSITVTVNVAGNAVSPQVNQVSVQGGGSAEASASDATTIIPLAAVLSISKTHTSNFPQGQTGATYTLAVTNTGMGPTNGAATVTDTLPAGLTLVSMVGPAPCIGTTCSGWMCSGNSCTRSDALAAGASYPAIIVTVSVAANSPLEVVNQATVSGAGSASASATDPTAITPSQAPAFFSGSVNGGNGTLFLQFADGTDFGYYGFLGSGWLYHADLGYEYAMAGAGTEVSFYDLASGHWLYTDAGTFPYLYDFTLGAWLYYFPNTSRPGHYTTNPRYFANLSTGVIFSM